MLKVNPTNYQKALEIMRDHKIVSMSLLNRKMKIGYAEAARLIDAMEKDGFVSPMAQDGSRTILTP